jgi:hypothetical protein
VAAKPLRPAPGRRARPDWPVPDPSPFAYAPQNLRVVGAGIKLPGGGERQARGQGVRVHRHWSNEPHTVGIATADTRAVEVAFSHNGDSHGLSRLPEPMPAQGRRNHDRGGQPQHLPMPQGRDPGR